MQPLKCAFNLNKSNVRQNNDFDNSAILKVLVGKWMERVIPLRNMNVPRKCHGDTFFKIFPVYKGTLSLDSLEMVGGPLNLLRIILWGL